MKKLFSILLVLIITLALSGCDFMDEVPVVVETEIVEIEVPVIVVETEVVEIEIPTIIKEVQILEVEVPVVVKEYTEVEVPIYIETSEVTTLLFETAETNEAIFIITKGEESYVMQFLYEDTLLGSPKLHFIKIEHIYAGVVLEQVLPSQIDGYEAQGVVDYAHFLEEVTELIELATWDEMQLLIDTLLELESEET